jgi:signal recognition particle subunit SRP54
MTSWSSMSCRRRRPRRAQDRQPARADPDGRPAGLGQDHHHRQARQAPEGARGQEGADGLARREPPRRDGAAGHPRQQIGVDTLPIVKGEDPVAIAKRAKTQASLGGYDVYMLDTAGRLHIDDELMAQVEAVRDVANPRETLLVVDGLTGQDAVNVAENFDDKIGVTGVVLTRMDGDGRGGAALSMRAVTGKPIRFVGLGEKMDALETFEPERIAGRILGMGDIVALVEKAQETIEAEQAERMMKRFQKGQFNMNDLKMPARADDEDGRHGGHDGHDARHGQDAEADRRGRASTTRSSSRQIALIQSMTKKERANPQILQASRKKRIAGRGLEVSDLNKLLKMHRQMADMMKKMGKMGKKRLSRISPVARDRPADPARAPARGFRGL